MTTQMEDLRIFGGFLIKQKFSHIVERRYLIFTKDLKKDAETLLLPVYMTQFL